MPKRLTMEDAYIEAKKHSGECLSEVYVNNSTKMHWKCKFGHLFNMCIHNVKSGQWCKICASHASWETRRLTEEDAHELAAKHNGIFLPQNFRGANKKYRWKCSLGHEFEALYYNVLRSFH
jgi:hypothetical protein